MEFVSIVDARDVVVSLGASCPARRKCEVYNLCARACTVYDAEAIEHLMNTEEARHRTKLSLRQARLCQAEESTTQSGTENGGHNGGGGIERENIHPQSRTRARKRRKK